MLFDMAIIHNKKASFNFELLERFEAGIELFGHEVKAIKAGKAHLEGARVLVRGGEVYLVGATIFAYQESNSPKTYNPMRNRRLLLHKKEMLQIASAEATKGLTIVPISMYNKGRKLKLEIAIARGKKLTDKRETIKKRDTNRDVERETKFKLK
jgi:SsrA-binding protein